MPKFGWAKVSQSLKAAQGPSAEMPIWMSSATCWKNTLTIHGPTKSFPIAKREINRSYVL
ncbi:hypothetical protein SAMCFNEI73_pB0502 (plasmid) [Sinorhizobium americanum]|uniref:Uncharacterized protein n=1 Tax=Sinorhizobium americanum TaxID=194963 RepID=A0A1L3LUD8_9HYPH|nr:hypothetical protein SAMCFNEI73_pB0502 [Sinorhizobium americanum]